MLQETPLLRYGGGIVIRCTNKRNTEKGGKEIKVQKSRVTGIRKRTEEIVLT
jgi:hypothetical protein